MGMKVQRKISNCKGLSLPELMIAVLVFLVAIIGIVYSYLKFLELQDIGRNVSIATQAVRNQMENIKNYDFNSISADFDNTTFTAVGINGRGVIYVNDDNPQLLQVKVVFCFRQPNGRLIGEDTNLDGVLNAGEDANGNGQIDSYVQVTTNIFG